MKITGKIKVINDTEQITDSFKKRTLVVTTQDEYPQHIIIEFVQDKCGVLDNYNAGDEVEVLINIRGREWTSKDGEIKYFNSIQGWKINKSGGQQSSEPNNTVSDRGDVDGGDDLPF